jgi:hypothetical protein
VPDHCIVVDTNVFAVAEGLHDGASDECVLACIRIIRAVSEGRRLGVDSGDLILQEYVTALAQSRRAGIATKLAQRLWRTRFDTAVCHRIDITQVDAPPGAYAEVPAALQGFDTDDQKFLAVAAAEGESPQVLQALDLEWWSRRGDFGPNGFDVQFICLADLLVVLGDV